MNSQTTRAFEKATLRTNDDRPACNRSWLVDNMECKTCSFQSLPLCEENTTHLVSWHSGIADQLPVWVQEYFIQKII